MVICQEQLPNRYISDHHIGCNTAGMENRLQEIREKAGLSREALAKKLNTATMQVYNLERGNRRLSDVWLAKLSEVFGLPQGAFLSDGAVFEAVNPNIRQVPVIDYVQAGEFVDTANPYPKGEGMATIAVEYKHDRIFGLKVRGESMNRTFKEGAIVIVDYTDTDLIDRKYYVISNGDGATVKLYRSNPIRFEPESLSTDFDPIYPDQSTRVIGRVVHSVSTF